MKWILITLLSVGFLSCKEDDQSELPSNLFLNNGDVTVLLNGTDTLDQFSNRVAATIGSSTACHPDKLSFGSIYYNSQNIQRISFSISNTPLAVGQYAISRVNFGDRICSSDILAGHFFTSVADGDVGGDIYLPVEGEENFVTVSTYNETTKEIEGTFQITFAIELIDHRPERVSGLPDTIRLTQGRFQAVIVEHDR